jgi:hypothetical protein
MKSSGSVSVKLSNKRAKLALQLTEIMNKITGSDGKDYSFSESVMFLISYLGLLIRIIIFHRKLFQLFVYYFYYHPNCGVENIGDGFSTIKFTPEERVK